MPLRVKGRATFGLSRFLRDGMADARRISRARRKMPTHVKQPRLLLSSKQRVNAPVEMLRTGIKCPAYHAWR